MNLMMYPRCASLNDVINEEGNELIDVITVDIDDKDTIVIDEKVKQELINTLSVLDERERNIIECYYGIDTGCESMTLEAIGEKYSLTKERIRQIKEKAIRKLRHNAHNLYNLINE